MQLYRKRLMSIDDLKREKIRLRYERRSTKAKHLLPDIRKAQKKLLGGRKSSGGGSGNIMKMAMGLLSGGSPVQTALSVAGPAMNLLLKGNSAPKRILGRILKDIVVSYLAGKALQLAISAGKAYLKARKAKKAMAAAVAH